MRIVVLVKPVPDPAATALRMTDTLRLDRSGPAVVNGNDEYALEAALKLVEAHGGEVTLLSMAPPTAPDTMRKALAMGAQRGVLLTDSALEGSDAVSTARVLASALKTLEYDLVLAGVDTSDSSLGVVAAAVATLVGLPYLSYAAKIEPTDSGVRVHRISTTGYDVLEAPLPALIACTQALGEPRYPSLKGIMAARSKEIVTRALADAELSPDQVGGGVATVTVENWSEVATERARRVIREPAPEAASEVVGFLAERRLI